MAARRRRRPLPETLIGRVREVLRKSPSRDDALLTVSRLLKESVRHYDWVGFYLADPGGRRELVLGPCVGEPAEHVRIPFGRGICGRAAESRKTLVVPDVSKETNYLSCSAKVKSEIVVPILKDGRFVGQIDVDSHTVSAFGDADRALLEEVCGILSELF